MSGIPDSGRDLEINNPIIKARELFVSDVTDIYPVSSLRGRCHVVHFQEVSKAKEFQPLPDTFFYTLGYNPETKRLATTQGEIRVGPSHQARLPEYHPNVLPDDMPEKCEPWEDLMWQPSSVMDGDLIMYLRAARSMAAFAGMCDGGSTEDGCQAASMDETTISAMDTLHRNSYDTGRALQDIVRKPVPRSIDKKWNEEETKRFVKGLRQHGKNFFKIKKDLLPFKETGDLVEYYYCWKKTPAAANTRPHRRHRRTALRRQPRTPRPPSSEYFDLSSASEVSDNDSDDSDSRDLSGYACRHCFTTTSKDWHHAGKDRALLCTECRLFFKKYGEERPVDKGEAPPFMFQPVKEDDSINGKHTMRTRRSKESGSVKVRSKKDRQDTSTPDNVDSPVNSSASSKDIAGRKSPSTFSTSSNSSTDKDKKPATNSHESILKTNKRSADNSESEDNGSKIVKKALTQERPESPTESSTDSSSVPGDDENGNEGDIENNQDDLSTSGSSVPSPAEETNTEFKPSPHIAEEVPETVPRIPTPVSETPLNIEPCPEEKPVSLPTAPLCVLAPPQLEPLVTDIPQQLPEVVSEQRPEKRQTDSPPLRPAVAASPPPQSLVPSPSPPATLAPVQVTPSQGLPPSPSSPLRGGPPPLQQLPPQGPPIIPPPPIQGPSSQGPPPHLHSNLPSQSYPHSHSHPPPHPHLHPLSHHHSHPPHPHPHLHHNPHPHPHSNPLGGPSSSHRPPSSGPPGPPPPLAPLPGSQGHPLPGLSSSSSLSHSGVLIHPGGLPLLPIKQERPDSPGIPKSPLARPSSRSPGPGLGPVSIPRPRSGSPTKSHSPTRSRSPTMMMPMTQSRSRSRSRSRSPIRDTDSPESDRHRSPSPEPCVVNEQCHKSTNAIFVKHLWRGYNTCSRCDFQFQPLPDSRLGQKRNECTAKRVEPTPPTPPVVASPVKEIKKEERKEELKASHSHTSTPPSNPTADAQITSSFVNAQHLPP